MDAVQLAEPPQAQRDLRVFVVEDAPPVKQALAALLRVVDGAALVGMESSEALALDWARRHRDGWDLAIVDLILHEGAGFNVIQRFRQEHPQGRIVVFSAYLSKAIHDHCLNLGADIVLRKEDTVDLIAYIEQLAD